MATRLSAIARRDTGPTYREMLTWMAKERGIDTRGDGQSHPLGSCPQGQKARQTGFVEQRWSQGCSRSELILSTLEGMLMLGRLSGQTPGLDATIVALLNWRRPSSPTGGAPASH
ncbi:MAG: hypothetical protein ACRECU_12775 [Methylocella sp.]